MKHQPSVQRRFALASLTAMIVMVLASASTTAMADQLHSDPAIIPPLFSMGSAIDPGGVRVITVPSQAGAVRASLKTQTISNRPATIVKGDKYYSLCVSLRVDVLCAPIVAVSVMQDIEVGSMLDTSNRPALTFRIDPTSSRKASHLTSAIDYFLARNARQEKHFARRLAAMGSPGLPPPGVHDPKSIKPSGPQSATVGGERQSECIFDPWGGIDCSGGDSGDGGHLLELFKWPSGELTDDPYLRTYAPNADNGDRDPCIDNDGNNTCQRVIINGPRPGEEVGHGEMGNTCVISGFGIACRLTPPVAGGDPYEEPLPPANPWFAQSTCNKLPILCSDGQAPDQPAPPVTEGEKRMGRLNQCLKEADIALRYCNEMWHHMGNANYEVCRRNALDQYNECEALRGAAR